MNVVLKVANLHSARAVRQPRPPVIILNGDLLAADGRDPSNMPVLAGVCLRNGSDLGRLVDGDAGLARGIVKRVGVEPHLALVVRVELDAEVVEAPRDEAGALALGESPGIVVAVVTLAAVRVVVGTGSESVGVLGGRGHGSSAGQS